MLEARKQGPALKNRLVGDAEMHERLLNREPLRAADGVKYFRDTLRPHFSKSVQSVFLWRFHQFNRARRVSVEMVKWIGKFTLLLISLRDARLDMLPISAMSEQVTTHERLFPFSHNLTTLMIIDLSEAQRDRLTSFPSPESTMSLLVPLKQQREYFGNCFVRRKVQWRILHSE